MANLFNSIKLSKPSSSAFDLSHDVKMSMNMAEIVPTVCIDCIPGEKFDLASDVLIRFSPLVSPVMHRIDYRMEYYFVPCRLLWENWNIFITNNSGRVPPFTDSLPACPFIDVDDTNWNELMDYFGIPKPPGVLTPGQEERINAMPFAAYQMIYNEYYRDQNLIDPVPFQLLDGDNTASAGDLCQIQNRAYEHDYFTSALPFAQKGEVVNLPIGSPGDLAIYKNTSPVGAPGVDVPATAIPGGAPDPFSIPNLETTTPGIAADALYADNTGNAQATTITDLRRATKLQEWLEKLARGGNRAIEVFKAFFGVISSDQRLDRPEYIVGSKSPVIISEVLSTAETTGNPQGNMAGHAVSVSNGNYGSYRCEEHGYIIGLMTIMPKTAYGQGIPKHFTKVNNPFEWFWPQFENIGEQPIENREIFAYTVNGKDTFGYIPRYSEYKFMHNRVAGDFRDTLDFWTMTRFFSSMPLLNKDFIEADPDQDNMNRIFAVTDPTVRKIYCHILHKIRGIRPMSKYGNPMF